uniref:Uncharacterized protein n=1 Tax=Trichogramma kaykai TaxID=54128 RepID=A0ABD2X5G3_9HYME
MILAVLERSEEADRLRVNVFAVGKVSVLECPPKPSNTVVESFDRVPCGTCFCWSLTADCLMLPSKNKHCANRFFKCQSRFRREIRRIMLRKFDKKRRPKQNGRI